MPATWLMASSLVTVQLSQHLPHQSAFLAAMRANYAVLVRFLLVLYFRPMRSKTGVYSSRVLWYLMILNGMTSKHESVFQYSEPCTVTIRYSMLAWKKGCNSLALVNTGTSFSLAYCRPRPYFQTLMKHVTVWMLLRYWLTSVYCLDCILKVIRCYPMLARCVDRSASFLAEISVSSPRKLFIFIIKKYIFWIKVSKK